MVILLLAGCADPPCGAFDSEVHGAPDWARLVDRDDGTWVVAGWGPGVQWRRVYADRRLGPVEGEHPDALGVPWWVDPVWLAVADGERLRVIGSTEVAYLSDDVEPVEIDFTEVSDTGAELIGAWAVDGTIHVLWRAPPHHADLVLVGLGTLTADDRVLSSGVPFHVGTPRVDGGWDAVLGRFWFDRDDRGTVVGVGPDGTVLQELAVPDGEVPYLPSWVQLPSGRFASLHGGWLQSFTPDDRSSDPVPFPDPVGDVFAPSLSVRDDGALWSLFPGDPTVLRAWREDGDTLVEDADPVSTPTSIRTCQMVFYEE